MPPAIDYAPYRPRMIRWRRWLLGAFLIMCAISSLAVLVSIPYKLSEHRICQECGLYHRDIHYWSTTFLSSSMDRETPVNDMLLSAGRMPVHAHRFVLMTANEAYLLGGSSCGLGSGCEVYGNASDPRAAFLLDGLYRSGQIATAETWRVRLLDMTTAREARKELYSLDIPFEGFVTLDEFLAWQKRRAFESTSGRCSSAPAGAFFLWGATPGGAKHQLERMFRFTRGYSPVTAAAV